jgi:eukaryotic-like serine/threonine-protein kinase
MIEEEKEDDDAIDSLLREAGRIPQIPEEPDRVGQKLGRYRIDSEIGRGGMGIVYAAEDLELGRRVALKVLPHAALGDDERRRRFLREARTAAKVSHPNLAAMFDVGEADGTVFLAMELVKGDSLRERVGKHGMTPADAIAIAIQIAHGLGKAHASGVVHRDLKPENVMLDADGRVKIVDFGLAKLAAAADEKAGADLSTQEGKILGTPSYMAPEQAKGSRVGPTADVFSLGVVLYEMLTGERPFAGASLVDVLVAVARDEAPRPSKRRPGIPSSVDAIVLRCLAKDPKDRFAEGYAVAHALEACTLHKTRRPRLAYALAGIAVAAGVALGVRSLASRPSVPVVGPTTAITTMTTMTAQPAAPLVGGDGVQTMATPDADAPSVALPVSSPSRPGPRVVARPPMSATSAPATSVPPARGSVDPLARQK